MLKKLLDNCSREVLNCYLDELTRVCVPMVYALKLRGRPAPVEFSRGNVGANSSEEV